MLEFRTMSSASIPYADLQERLGYSFARVELLEMALTHRSFANETGFGVNYERLEFLGDAVLGLLTAEWLYLRNPGMTEGELSKLKSQLVRTGALAVHARRLGLGEALRLGVGEARSGGGNKVSLLADVLEATLGAIWLDAGVEPVRAVVAEMLEFGIVGQEALSRADSKTQLQEAVQARGWELPEYRVVAEEGPDHSKLFRIECWFDGALRGTGEGKSKKQAQQRAASEALAYAEG